MRAVPFDTMEYMQELRNGGMNQDEAEALTKATAKAFAKAMDDKNLVTKNDLRDEINGLEIRLLRSQSELIWKIIGFVSAIQILSLTLYTFAQHFITKVT